MKRKMIIGAVALLVTAGVANAQGFAEAKFGIKGGWNSANITNNKGGETDDSKRLNTFNAGVVGAIPLGSTFEIRTGLDLQSKGTKVSWDNAAGKGFAKTNPLYLELPVIWPLCYLLMKK
ncbi:PorT family protein [Niabella sp. W65]|nr:PorT family protein [Niabella sp. W65]MCH7366818.1 PorT family protein [Niabella sp. W65]